MKQKHNKDLSMKSEWHECLNTYAPSWDFQFSINFTSTYVVELDVATKF